MQLRRRDSESPLPTIDLLSEFRSDHHCQYISMFTYAYRYIFMCACGYICRDEIQRIKAANPDISHREAFSAAAKNVS